MTAVEWVLGATFGLGAWLVVVWGYSRRPTLEVRIAPFVRPTAAVEARRRATAVTPLPTVERLLAPLVSDLGRVLERWGTSTLDLERRLRRAGGRLTVEQYRAQQVACAAAALAASTLAAAALMATRGTSILVAGILVVTATAGGALARDAALTAAIRRRSRRIAVELPTIAEMLALAVGAGESAPAALERVSTSASGVVADELGRALARVRAGTRLPRALEQMARDMAVPSMDRFADAVATAIDRGTPLADVLRAQAQDVRAAGHQELIEEGGRREIAMMVPVVFLILPVTVLFAVFPGLVAIRLGG
ncbi:type II secretion system F family protein [Demequina sp.]|uniref:type II secretion system F family protein n=1 Tax=Demequina sp. TaxID=2050685 RepID=UPI003A8ADC82